MPILSKSSDPRKLYLKSFSLCVFSFSSSSSSSSSSIPPPTHHHIAQLILDQPSASQALQTFRWASKLPNFNHSQSTYRALIHKLCTFRRFDTVHHLLDEMPSTIGSPPDEDIFLTLIRGLGRARMTPQLIKVLAFVSRFHGKPSLKIFNSILNVLVKDNIDIAREFYRKKMMAAGVLGDDYTFGILMKGLCSTNRIADAFKLLQVIKSRGVIPNAIIYNTLLHALCKNGKVGRARSLMNDMEKPSDVTFNVLICAYCAEDNLVQALVLLHKCYSSGLVPDIVPVTKVLELLCRSGRTSEAVEILETWESKGGTVDVVAYNTLIKGFVALGKVRVGHRILKEMEAKGCLPNVETYNLLISGLCEFRMLDSALDLFNDMKTDGVKRNFVTYDTLMRGLCSVGRTEDGFRILQLMEESRECGQISPYNSILHGLYKQNRTDEALEFLANMGKLFPRVVDKSLRILDLCKERKIEDAKTIYDEMVEEGGAPSAVVYSWLIHGFCEEGRVREAFELMNEMISHGCSSPAASTLNALVHGFCRQGKSDSAVRLIEDMVGRGCTLDAGSYNAVILAICRQGDLHKASKVLTQMIENGIVPGYFEWSSLLLCLYQETRHIFHVNKLLDYIINT
ncbi:pentatricopeptide repeat-containing protein At2g17525, mitochondrial [Humulus lupulus]|uniref:pentatricopeptide repeat-containing protein At2g17525, mitochondrial n=1 Tax=Humulus lupulus TaxID=3486 RepID=UPI002B41292A|nr:pentatricopeptide repeat-containing protein At2g17525, mitochondrial [Humulus lupulus]